MSYVGRFAPSPSGPLHFGSLIAALGSYFQARSHNGKWLVRIEDIDPPREVIGADKWILETLEAYHLYWDDSVMYQSQRLDTYQAKIDEWQGSGQAYYCGCTRKQIRESGGFYLGTCRNQQHLYRENGAARIKDSAIRLKVDHPIELFYDEKHGKIAIPPSLANEDFIIKRRDGLFAYNLAVVLDDIEQKVTQVVRGADLIEPTGRQIYLYHLLGRQPISYLHLPLAIDKSGQKLSKQNHATAIDKHHPKPTLIHAMQFLGFRLPSDIEQGSVDEILLWGCQNWSLHQLPDQFKITSPFSNGAS